MPRYHDCNNLPDDGRHSAYTRFVSQIFFQLSLAEGSCGPGRFASLRAQVVGCISLSFQVLCCFCVWPRARASCLCGDLVVRLIDIISLLLWCRQILFFLFCFFFSPSATSRLLDKVEICRIFCWQFVFLASAYIFFELHRDKIFN